MRISNMPKRENGSTDATLLDRFRRGDDDAATELYTKYAARIQDLAFSETSAHLRSQVEPEDVVQSVFRTFFRRVSDGFFEVPPGDEIWNLFLVIALNKIRRSARFHNRKKRDLKLKKTLNETVEPVQDSDNTPFVALQMTIDEILEGVEPRQRKMIEMRIQGSELDEIAEQTHRSIRSVERVLKQFRDKLSRQINVT